jgi:hypothetical protein
MGKLSWMTLVVGFLAAELPCAALKAQEKLNAAALATRIDQRLAEKWKSVQPAPLAEDGEFLRRVYLDLAGRIPRVKEIRDFLEDPATDRRNQVIDHLLDSPQYVNHFSTTWRNLLLPPTNNQQFAFLGNGFKPWLEEQVRNNTPYDKMIRDILTVSLVENPRQPGLGVVPQQGPSPAAFFLANEKKPENLAGSTARIFMGVRLECAQCHDHPFAHWSRTQFWEMAAFFATVQPEFLKTGKGAVVLLPAKPRPREIKIPGTDKVVRAKFLTGKDPELVAGAEPRTILAAWLTDRANPYFAQTAVNRVWSHFFGVGLIDPVDDEPTDENPASHPELLADLCRQFVAHDYDIKYLIRAITATKAYQRTSSQTHATQADPRAFARMSVRGLTPEQLFDSIALATGFKEPPANPNIRLINNPNTPRGDFLNRFASQERVTEKQTSILQALALMNGKFVADATSLERSTTLAAVADAPFMSLPQKIETLYLATLCRQPRPEETQRLSAYVEGGGPRRDARLALGDVFWALLNSSEFILNH